MLLLILLGWGVGWLLARSGLFAPVRALAARVPVAGLLFAGLLSCAACVGFWVGLGLAGLAPALRPAPGFWGVLTAGVVVMGVNAVLDGLVGLLAVAAEFLWAMRESHTARHAEEE